MDEQRLHNLMLTPVAYPFPVKQVDWHETHISRVYFIDDLVLKIKKPVNFGFVDFSTPALRRHFCREEIRLNRRFAPDTYLATVAIDIDDDRLRIRKNGKTNVEWGVMMRRLPIDAMLSTLLATGTANLVTDMQRLAQRLTHLHKHSRIYRSGDGCFNLQQMQTNWNENFVQCRTFPESILLPQSSALLSAYVDDYFSKYQQLLRSREQSGLVRDGHGDLHAEHICLTDPIRIYDCIEFNQSLRIGDILSDLAFLLMDLEFRGHWNLADKLLHFYQEAFPKIQVEHSLLTFYLVYRAFVRGKVNGLLAADRAAADHHRNEACKTAGRYFNYALAKLIKQPVLILTCGLMGTGKTTIAEQLAGMTGAKLLRSDCLRKELAGIETQTSVNYSFGSGLYSQTMTMRTYDTMLQHTLEALDQKLSVIVDASFIDYNQRERFWSRARDLRIPVLLLYCLCPYDVAADRMKARRAQGHDASDGRPDLWPQQSAAFTPPSEAEQALTIDTRANLHYNIQKILLHLIGHTSRS